MTTLRTIASGIAVVAAAAVGLFKYWNSDSGPNHTDSPTTASGQLDPSQQSGKKKTGKQETRKKDTRKPSTGKKSTKSSNDKRRTPSKSKGSRSSKPRSTPGRSTWKPSDTTTKPKSSQTGKTPSNRGPPTKKKSRFDRGNTSRTPKKRSRFDRSNSSRSSAKPRKFNRDLSKIDTVVQVPGGPRIDVRATLERIKQGKKFPHRNDGSVFGNRERRLPIKQRGYYREYVHPTPRRRGPGARRIVIGNGGEIYYTHDHYETFIRVDKKR